MRDYVFTLIYLVLGLVFIAFGIVDNRVIDLVVGLMWLYAFDERYNRLERELR